MHLKNMDPMQNNIVVLQKITNLFVDRHTIGSEFFMHISKYIFTSFCTKISILFYQMLTIYSYILASLIVGNVRNLWVIIGLLPCPQLKTVNPINTVIIAVLSVGFAL